MFGVIWEWFWRIVEDLIWKVRDSEGKRREGKKGMRRLEEEVRIVERIKDMFVFWGRNDKNMEFKS